MLVFGESENDTKVISELIVALCPEFDGKVMARRKPPILIKDCDASKLPDRVQMVTSVIKAEQTDADVICVFAHQDCDEIEPAHVALTDRIEQSFLAAGYPVHAVTPAWETESWLFLWPAAVAAYRPSWRSLDRYRGRDVGRIADAKEQLTRALRQGSASNLRDYRESDAPLIAKKVRELGIVGEPAGKSRSYEFFRDRVVQCCSQIG